MPNNESLTSPSIRGIVSLQLILILVKVLTRNCWMIVKNSPNKQLVYQQVECSQIAPSLKMSSSLQQIKRVQLITTRRTVVFRLGVQVISHRKQSKCRPVSLYRKIVLNHLGINWYEILKYYFHRNYLFQHRKYQINTKTIYPNSRELRFYHSKE